jgi:hypothetical protein
MTCQELSNMIFNIKEKITDKEFKDIMDALGIVHKKDEKQDVYLFKYYKMKLDIGRTHNGFIGNRLKYKYKERKVVLHHNTGGESAINDCMDYIKNVGNSYEFYIKKDKENKENYPQLMRSCKTINRIESMKRNDEEDDEDDDDIVLLEYNEIIPISIEKL